MIETTVNETVTSRLGFAFLLTNKAPFQENDRTASDLKYIGLLATGYNVVDIIAAAERHITGHQCSRVWNAIRGSDGIFSTIEPLPACG